MVAVSEAAKRGDVSERNTHQHTNYSGGSDEDLIAHQRKMGVTRTVLPGTPETSV